MRSGESCQPGNSTAMRYLKGNLIERSAMLCFRDVLKNLRITPPP
jgi:hypothetical protein